MQRLTHAYSRTRAIYRKVRLLLFKVYQPPPTHPPRSPVHHTHAKARTPASSRSVDFESPRRTHQTEHSRAYNFNCPINPSSKLPKMAADAKGAGIFLAGLPSAGRKCVKKGRPPAPMSIHQSTERAKEQRIPHLCYSALSHFNLSTCCARLLLSSSTSPPRI
jgi:hypothetical protein